MTELKKSNIFDSRLEVQDCVVVNIRDLGSREE